MNSRRLILAAELKIGIVPAKTDALEGVIDVRFVP
jgi:hypothetical protein